MVFTVARIGKPHGIRGEVTAEIFTDVPDKRFVVGAKFETKPPKFGTLIVKNSRWNKACLILGFENIVTRNEAETLRNVELLLEIEAELEHDAWYEKDLVGFKVFLADEEIGVVTGLECRDVQDILVFTTKENNKVMIPFVKELVTEIFDNEKYLRINPPVGLLELNSEKNL